MLNVCSTINFLYNLKILYLIGSPKGVGLGGPHRGSSKGAKSRVGSEGTGIDIWGGDCSRRGSLLLPKVRGLNDPFFGSYFWAIFGLFLAYKNGENN